MKARLAISLLLTLVPFSAGCDGDVAASDVVARGKEAAGRLADDLSDLSVDELKAKAASVSEELGRKLSRSIRAIEDRAGAVELEKRLEPLLERLAALKSALGEKMPRLDELKRALEELETRLADRADVLEALKPLVDDLERLLR